MSGRLIALISPALRLACFSTWLCKTSYSRTLLCILEIVHFHVLDALVWVDLRLWQHQKKASSEPSDLMYSVFTTAPGLPFSDGKHFLNGHVYVAAI